jgi:hypothetical protein
MILQGFARGNLCQRYIDSRRLQIRMPQGLLNRLKIRATRNVVCSHRTAEVWILALLIPASVTYFVMRCWIAHVLSGHLYWLRNSTGNHWASEAVLWRRPKLRCDRKVLVVNLKSIVRRTVECDCIVARWKPLWHRKTSTKVATIIRYD